MAAPRKRARFNIPEGNSSSVVSDSVTIDLSDEDKPKAPPRTAAAKATSEAAAAQPRTSSLFAAVQRCRDNNKPPAPLATARPEAAAPQAAAPQAAAPQAASSPAATPQGYKASLIASAAQSPPPAAPKPSPPSSPAKARGKAASPKDAKAAAAKAKAAAAAAMAPLPRGNDGKPGLPLEGLVMAFTGEMDSLTRQDAEEKAKAAGAKVMGSVSGNTNFLVLGSHLDDGRDVKETSKYRKYLELKEKGKKCPRVVEEEEFLKMLPAHVQAPPAAPMPAPEPRKAEPGGTSVASLAVWVDSHAPKSFGEVLGNATGIRKLTEWLRDWDDVVLRGKKKAVAFRPGGGAPDNVNARAALISGPPGIGKTTSCRLVAQTHGGYEILEYNASDARGQSIINEMAAGIADNKTLNFSGGMSTAKKLTKRAIIIMDEVDGMGGGDRGGNAALIRMIKKTRNPIICICNDAGSPKVRSLANSCYDIKFTRPTKNTVAQRCAQIARQEGLEVEPNALEALAESCGSDMRMVLNQLQMISRNPRYRQSGMKYTDMKEKLQSITKDQSIMMSTFDAARKLLTSSEGARMSFRDRMDLFFVDHSIMGLLVQENYLASVGKKPVDVELLNRCAYSADLMTVGDIMNSRIRDSQEWSLLPDVGLTGCVYPAHITNGFVSFPSFPQFLGKYSTQSRMNRLCKELQVHLRLTASVGKQALPTSGYPSLLYKRAMDPLMKGSPDCIDDTVASLDVYGLRKDHLTEHLTELRTHLGEDDLFKLVDPKVKAAMTREFNSGSHAMKVVIPQKGKRKAAAEVPEGYEDEDDDAPPPEAKAEEEEDEQMDGMVKIKAKAKAKGKAKAKAKADAESPAATPKGKAKAKGKRKA